MTQFGILFFQPVGTYGKNMEATYDPLPKHISEWIPITSARKYEEDFLLEVANPVLKISMRFNTQKKSEGNYTIVAKKRLDSGTIEKVSDIIEEDPADLLTPSVMRTFPIRYRVLTLTDDRQRSRNVWFIALSHFEEIPTEN